MKSLSQKTKTTSKKIVFAIIALVLLVALGGTALALQKTLFNQQPGGPAAENSQQAEDKSYDNSVNYDPPTEEEKTATQQQKEEIINPPAEQPSGTLNITISRAGQGAPGQPLNIRTVITGSNAGTCKVTLSHHSHIVSKQFPIVFEATSATCQAADIPAEEFPESGEWQLSVIAESPNFNPGTATATVTISK